MKIKIGCLVLFLVSVLFSSCQNDRKEQPKTKPAPTTSNLIKLNQDMVREENMLIDNYLRRHNIPALTGRGGMRYYIYQHGKGPQVKVGDKVRFNYEVRFLTGDIVYDSKTDGPREATLGKTTIETGLYDGILMMHVGDRAKIILPSHLAFGAGGDGQKVPPRTTLVYDIELINAN